MGDEYEGYCSSFTSFVQHHLGVTHVAISCKLLKSLQYIAPVTADAYHPLSLGQHTFSAVLRSLTEIQRKLLPPYKPGYCLTCL